MSTGIVCTWTTFKVSTSELLDVSIFDPFLTAKEIEGPISDPRSMGKRFDESIFDPLSTGKATYHSVLYGRIQESPDEYVLVIGWESLQHYQAFAETDEHKELMANLKPGAKTHVIDFGQFAFWRHLNCSTEILTVYFPSSILPQDQEAVGKIYPLIETLQPIDRASIEAKAYTERPICGWMKDSFQVNGKNTLACVWFNFWKNRENENRFKRTERRSSYIVNGPFDITPIPGPLALEVFEQDLKGLGAGEWVGFHVDFKCIQKTRPYLR
ncbi:hypothetical protein B0T10DRAFT_493714 [Thelonectria olida]|uniref:ABM domain-containing protein n=1 Tax=Thelonectria olida TaxID=1576542 RepID=A0A9P8VYQ9_9HYPO|nr:hypothetical protein B0T10DRAFT_493714 [Thelonectria olida]